MIDQQNSKQINKALNSNLFFRDRKYTEDTRRRNLSSRNASRNNNQVSGCAGRSPQGRLTL